MTIVSQMATGKRDRSERRGDLLPSSTALAVKVSMVPGERDFARVNELSAATIYGYYSYMKQAKISQLKNDLSRYLAYVRRGGTVRVFDRDQAVAELVPLGKAASAAGAEMESIAAELERQGALRRGRGNLPRDFVRRTLPTCTASVVEALLSERRGGR